MNVALVGYRGSGKTTVGKKLADRLWTKFVDVDDKIVEKAGMSIKDIFEKYGEPYYRELETEALRDVLKNPDIVLGLGGGTLGREENVKMLRGWANKIIYLKADPKELLRRIQADPQSAQTRPNLTNLGGGIEEIKVKLAEREPHYRAVMDSELDVTNLTPDEACVYIARML